MYVKKKETILRKYLKGREQHTAQITKILEVVDYARLNVSVLDTLVKNDVYHLCWCYFLVTRRYQRKSRTRLRYLGEPYNGSDWVRITDLYIEYWLAKGFSEEESKEKYKEACRKRSFSPTPETRRKLKEASIRNRELLSRKTKEHYASLTPEKREQKAEKSRQALMKAKVAWTPECTHTSVQYWINKGYTEEEARDIMSKRSSRSLQFFINRYGEEEGQKRFDAMRAKRSAAWKSKTDEQRQQINEKRRQNAHIGIYNENTIKGIVSLFFYMFSYDGGIKFGLTKQTQFRVRWPRNIGYELLYFEKHPASLALSLEQWVKRNFKCSYNQSLGTTEFIVGNANEIKSYILKHLEKLND